MKPDHPRTSHAGRKLGIVNVRLAEAGKRLLDKMREPDRDMCTSCAFRWDTVPNGCVQTQMDVCKALSERTPFMCHEDTHSVCQGWFRAAVFMDHTGIPVKQMDYEYSLPDEDEGTR